MLTVSWDTVRLFLHVLAATIWVGGQLTLAALVPVLRRVGPDAPRVAAPRFAIVAWRSGAALTDLTALAALFLGILLAG